MDFQIYEISIVPLIVGVVAVLTNLGLPKKLAPLVSVIIGALIGVFYIYPEDLLRGILVGVGIGLSSVGLYSGTKNTVELIKRE